MQQNKHLMTYEFIFYRNENDEKEENDIYSDTRKNYPSGSNDDSDDELFFRSSEKTEDTFSAEVKHSTLKKTLVLEMRDHLTFSITQSIIDTLSSIRTEILMHKEISTSRICNYTGQEGCIRYKEIVGGTEKTLVQHPTDEEVISSE